MAGTDIVFFYTDPDTGEAYYGVRDLYEAWVAAGSPPINSAGRLYSAQKAAWDNSPEMGGGGSPADNPDDPGNYELGHCRFAALDITPTPARVAALTAAGLVRPFWYESWHWRLPNIYNYPIVHSIPSSAAGGSTAFPTGKPVDTALLRRQKEQDMYIKSNTAEDVYCVYTDRDGKAAMRLATPAEAQFALQGGLVITANPEPVNAIGVEANYTAPRRTVADEVWGTTIQRYVRDAAGAIVKDAAGAPVIENISALQELANIRSEQIQDDLAPKG